MKSDERHELQQNDLDAFLAKVVPFLHMHGAKLLLGLAVILTLVLVINWRGQTAASRAALVDQSLAGARASVSRLATVDVNLRTADEIAEARKELAAQAESSIDTVLREASGDADTARAEAYLARGDLNWELANLAPLPAATTRPSLALQQESSSYLDAAEQAYRKVLSDFGDERHAAVAALLGLGAVEENRGNWEQAKAYYEQTMTDYADMPPFPRIAVVRLQQIETIRKPVFVAESTGPSTQPTGDLLFPTTGPASDTPLGPSISATTQPSETDE